MALASLNVSKVNEVAVNMWPKASRVCSTSVSFFSSSRVLTTVTKREGKKRLTAFRIMLSSLPKSESLQRCQYPFFSPPRQAFFRQYSSLDPDQLHRPDPVNIGGSSPSYLYFPLLCFAIKARINRPARNYITLLAGLLEMPTIINRCR